MEKLNSEYYYDVDEDIIWDVRNDQPYTPSPVSAQDLADVPMIRGWRRALIRDGEIVKLDPEEKDVRRAEGEGLTFALISF